MIAYKLLHQRKDGSFGPLFINRPQRLDVGVTYQAEEHRTKGYTFRPGWHACAQPVAPHLSKKSRVWVKVDLDGVETHVRPVSQGGVWYTAQQMKIVEVLS